MQNGLCYISDYLYNRQNHGPYIWYEMSKGTELEEVKRKNIEDFLLEEIKGRRVLMAPELISTECERASALAGASREPAAHSFSYGSFSPQISIRSVRRER